MKSARYEDSHRARQHIALVEALNGAKTEAEHREARARLDGFREGLRACGISPDLIGCDLFYINQGIDRPMCCGEFLDWKPVEDDQ